MPWRYLTSHDDAFRLGNRGRGLRRLNGASDERARSLARGELLGDASGGLDHLHCMWIGLERK